MDMDCSQSRGTSEAVDTFATADGLEMDQQPAPPATLRFVCSLCCDEKSTANHSIILTACGHQGCKECMAKWIEKQEATGKADSPTCPFCRVDIHDEEVISILGRPFDRRKHPAGVGNEEIDELTLQWLNEQTTLCPGCGSRVERTDGCDHMTCLCGCEFCYRCGEVRCLCNVVEGRGGCAYAQEEEPIRDSDGIVNIRACICRRNGRNVRRERERRGRDRRVEEEGRWAHADSRDPSFRHNPCDGSWLLSCRESSTSAIMLAQLSSSHWIRQHRYETRTQARIDEENRWAYTYKQIRSESLALTYNSCNGVWLYSCRKSSASVRVLTQQCDALGVRRQREEQKLSQFRRNVFIYDEYIPPVCPSWLFANESRESQLLALRLILFLQRNRWPFTH